MSENRQFRLKSRPTERASADHFTFGSAPVPVVGEGDALIKLRYLSMDPTNRIWMSDRDQYMPPVEIGAVMRGVGIGEVVESRTSQYAVGDIVTGMLGWQDYVLASETGGVSVLPRGLPIGLPVMLNVLGGTGITAWFGLVELAKPKEGETLVVSAATGAVGSVVGQIGKSLGLRVVGITGGRAKCDYLLKELGFDAAVDYRADDFAAQLVAATPDGIDIDFENVGGVVMREVMARMNIGGRVSLCGMISGYNSGEDMLGDYTVILMKRLTLRGFIITDFADRFMEAIGQLAGLLMAGKIKSNETIMEGLENAPVALNRLFDGDKLGKLMVKVS